MEESPFISICIPAYRRVEFLKRLLDSICAQTYQKFEVVLTDDSPGTEVQELVEGHPLKPKMRYFRNALSLGTPENWNESIRKASSDWIKIMHDDDWFSGPESLKAFADVASSGQNRFYFSGYINHYPDGMTKRLAISPGRLHAINKCPEELMAANRIGPPSVVIFKKDPSIVFDSRMQWLVDIDFYTDFLIKHPPAVYIPKYLVCIGISDSQVTRSSFGNRGVEIRERFLLAQKLGPDGLRNLAVYDSWWRFIRNMQIRDVRDIFENGYHGEIPDSIRNMIVYQSHFSSSLLQIGILSKLLMFQHFLRNKKKF